MSIDPEELTIYVVACGSLPYFEITLPIIEEYAKTHGYKFGLITEHPKDRRSPHWQKIMATRVCKTEVALVIDADIMPFPWAQPVHDFLSKDAISLCRDNGIFDGWNTGVWAMPRCWWDELNLFYENKFDPNKAIFYYEQGPFNSHIEENEIPINSLPDSFNLIYGGIYGTRYRKMEANKDKCNFLHFAGPKRALSMNVAEKRWYKERRLERLK